MGKLFCSGLEAGTVNNCDRWPRTGKMKQRSEHTVPVQVLQILYRVVKSKNKMVKKKEMARKKWQNLTFASALKQEDRTGWRSACGRPSLWRPRSEPSLTQWRIYKNVERGSNDDQS